jgi:hypothetical protein
MVRNQQRQSLNLNFLCAMAKDNTHTPPFDLAPPS